MNSLLINEVFGPTVQGEGPHTGRPCAFIRLAICPLHCKWCDTPYTWAFTEAKAQQHQLQQVFKQADEVHRMTVQETVDRVLSKLGNGRMVVISGGEPLAQVPPRLQRITSTKLEEDDSLARLVHDLCCRDVEVHFETAGIRLPSRALDVFTTQYVVSPKLETSGNSLRTRYVPDVLDFFANSPKAVFKFVITGEQDFKEVESITNAHHISPSRVWVMPEGTTVNEIVEKAHFVTEGALVRGYNVSTRLHTLTWGNQRGR